MHNEHDIRYKKLFSNVKLVQQLLETFVDEPFVKELDFNKAIRVEKSFVTESFAEKESDIIYRLRYKGQEVYLYLLIEFQSTVDKFMSVRMLRYILELYDSVIRESPKEKLPPVFPLMLYNGERKWTAPQQIADLIEQTIPVQYIPHFSYFKLAENEFDREYLCSLKNAVAALFYVETMSKDQIADSIDTIFTLMKKEQPEITHSITLFIRNYFKKDETIESAVTGKIMEEQEAKAMLSQTIEKWKEELISEGIEQGIEQDKIDTAQKMLNDGLTVEVISKYTGLSAERIKTLL